MFGRLRWIDSGGAHMLLEEELLPSWRGIEGWRDHLDPSDQSDYARACRAADSWLGLISCGDGEALILGGEKGLVAWLPTFGRTGGTLVQLVYANNEQELLSGAVGPLVRNAVNGPAIEKAEISTGPSGAMRLFDSAEPGNDIRGDSEVLALEPGRYLLSAAYVEVPGHFAMVVREITIWR